MTYTKNSYCSMKKWSISDPPTAVKSHYYEKPRSNQQINSPNSQPLLKYHEKIQQTKKTINIIIDQVAHKKKNNNQAVQKIRTTNKDIYGMLSVNGVQNYHKKQNPSNFIASTSQLYPYNPENYPYQFSLIKKNKSMAQVDPHRQNLQQENRYLREAPINKTKENKQLIKRIEFLERENYSLRNSLGTPASGTKEGRKIHCKTMTYSGNQSGGSTGKFNGSFDNSRNEGNSNIRNNQYGIYKELFRGLNELKKENQRLRINTIELMKMRN